MKEFEPPIHIWESDTPLGKRSVSLFNGPICPDPAYPDLTRAAPSIPPNIRRLPVEEIRRSFRRSQRADVLCALLGGSIEEMSCRAPVSEQACEASWPHSRFATRATALTGFLGKRLSGGRQPYRADRLGLAQQMRGSWRSFQRSPRGRRAAWFLRRLNRRAVSANPWVGEAVCAEGGAFASGGGACVSGFPSLAGF
jgi:hypothetical protein